MTQPFEHFTSNCPESVGRAVPNQHGIRGSIDDCWGPPRKTEQPKPIARPHQQQPENSNRKPTQIGEAAGVDGYGADRNCNFDASRRDAFGDVLATFSQPANTDDGARAADTQREENERNGKKRWELGIALEPDEKPESIAEQFGCLQPGKQAQLVMTGVCVFAQALNDQAWQMADGIHDGTANVAVGIFNLTATVGKTALDIAAAPQRLNEFCSSLQNDPIGATAEVVEKMAQAAATAAQVTGVADHSLDAVYGYARNVANGKAEPLRDISEAWPTVGRKER